jgi:preprotein translocase subunit SecG
MDFILLIIHLVICMALIGLVLLQRSEGGALGMGGGGGSLMSGRGAADALAKMTQVAGGFFLVTSLGLTILSGAGASADNGSVFDRILPRQEAPVVPAAPTQPDTTPDPTESSVTPDTQLASTASGPVEVATPPVADGATRAAPLPTATAAPTPQRPAVSRPAAATGTQTPVRPPAAARSETPTTPTPQPASGQALIIPNTSGAVSGVNLTDDAASQSESIEIGNGVEAVRRERAGPDQ